MISGIAPVKSPRYPVAVHYYSPWKGPVRMEDLNPPDSLPPGITCRPPVPVPFWRDYVPRDLERTFRTS